ncbi:monoamine oxidase [Nocardioides thalensis]|uniref:Monoamine oxidase n=1 Tax=Nocardioides thalensis TaxID=1914755 RepID=A0A853CA95_9ACTN|nr:NAD(P)/FAD-dependent oxidoreductase [Nocardioides thalensis]NYJ03133.1 monoamine oxidase [Nocardioides thalensis]
MRVAVVGAGLSGLSCAWMLSQTGHDVVVLEARDRVGGRTWSTTLPNGVVVERGGEWIDADQHTIRRVCAVLGLPLAPHGVRFHRRRVGGAVPTLAQLEETLTRVSAEIPPEDCSLADAFERALGDEYAANPAFLRIATSTAGDPSRASARFHVARAEAARIDGAARVVGGNQRICTLMAGALGDRVRLRTPVVAVSATDDGAAVTTASGEELVADKVVVAVPLALLDEIEWEPGFPDLWRAGLRGVLTGSASKLSVPTTSTGRPDGVQHPHAAWWAWNSLDPAGDDGVAAVSCFAGGDDARNGLAVGAGPHTWTRALAELRPELELRTHDALLTDWHEDPWCRGGYSYVMTGRHPAANDTLGQPVGPLLLAGEYTAGPASGTMDGALASGFRTFHLLAAGDGPP